MDKDNKNLMFSIDKYDAILIKGMKNDIKCVLEIFYILFFMYDPTTPSPR